MDFIRKHLGVESAGARVLIDERPEGFMTYRFEVQRERVSGVDCLRIMVTEFKGSGSLNGRSRKSFTWPTSDPGETLRQMTSQIIAAVRPEAEFIDNRMGIGRLFDRLTGGRYLNHIPSVLEHAGPPRHWVEATISEDRNGRIVSLVEKRDKRGQMWLRIPFASFEKLQRLLDGDGDI